MQFNLVALARTLLTLAMLEMSPKECFLHRGEHLFQSQNQMDESFVDLKGDIGNSDIRPHFQVYYV